MVALAFFQWWYGTGWMQLLRGVGGRIREITLTFSIPLLLRTLFAPWRRIISYGGDSVADKFRAMLDNLVSRAVGFTVRCVVIVAGLIAMVLIAVIGAIMIVLWPFLPAAAILLLVRGLFPW